jgi:NADH-quinone oxidoreductase subunit N
MGGVLDLRPVAPAAIVAVTGLVVLLAQAFSPKGKQPPSAALSLAGLAAAFAAVWLLATGSGRGSVMAGALAADDLSLFLHALVLGVAAVSVLLSPSYLRANGMERGEYYALLLFSVVGMLGLVSSLELVSIFVALEIMSIALYGMAGMDRRRVESQEAALKYFVTGAFASAFFLYGIALLYGASGSTSLDKVARAMAVTSGETSTLAVLGAAMLLVGFGFKVASVPFHMWVPDVYEGAPTTITALIATGSKAAAFAALIRVLVVALRGVQSDWSALLWGVAVLTMTLGNVVAIAQSNLKRMLAYSSIAHVGYMLMGLVAGGAPGAGSVLFYLLAYTFTTVGAFGVIALCARAGEEAVEVSDYSGLARRHPVLAATLALFLLSLIGIPPLAGFVAKFYLFGSAVRAGYIWLTVIAVLNSAVAAYYYLRVIVFMYMREPEGEALAVTPSFAGGLALGVALVGIVLLGVIPAPFADLAQAAVAPLLR